MDMSMVEVAARADFLIYNYLKKRPHCGNDLAEQFRKVIQESSQQKDIIIFKGLEDLTTVLMKYYSSQLPAVTNAEPNGPEASAEVADDALEEAKNEPNQKQQKKKSKKKRKTMEQIAAAPDAELMEQGKQQQPPPPQEAEPAAEPDESAVAANGSGSGGEDGGKKKKKDRKAEKRKRRQLEASEPANGDEAEAEVEAEAAPVEDAVAATVATEEAPKKKKRKKGKESAAAADGGAAATAGANGDCPDSAAAAGDSLADADCSAATNGVSDVSGGKKNKRHSEPYRRVREEEVVNKHFQDNRFEAKPGANTGWGYKANEDLKPTQGRSFRHEKTKKKRGSYKGGAIDTGVSSFKFESDSD